MKFRGISVHITGIQGSRIQTEAVRLIMELESCPVCWRDYSIETVPVCLSCGHSCCRECSIELRSCSLCRHKISNTFQRRTNFSLLSMIEKVAIKKDVQKTDQNTQTEPQMVQPEQRRTRQQQQTSSMMDGKTMEVRIRKSGIMLQFK